jgi:hypothetical protein
MNLVEMRKRFDKGRQYEDMQLRSADTQAHMDAKTKAVNVTRLVLVSRTIVLLLQRADVRLGHPWTFTMTSDSYPFT